MGEFDSLNPYSLKPLNKERCNLTSTHPNSVEVIQRTEAWLNTQFFERREVIHGLWLALIARQHVVLLGPPGAAKTALAELFAKVVSLKYWSTLLTRFSTPEELFGPLSLKGLDQDAYRRIGTGRLPDAEVALVDEIFKANSAILNTMLPVMNERVWFNDGQRLPLPLQLMIGASNEMPETEELNALWDRFALRYEVNYIQDPQSWDEWMTTMADPASVQSAVPMTVDVSEIVFLQDLVEKVDARPIIPTLGALKNVLAQEGIRLSDRRWGVAIRLIRAEAVLNGRDVATADDVRAVTGALWDTLEQQTTVSRVVLGLVAPNELEALSLRDDAHELLRAVAEAPSDKEKVEKAQEAGIGLKRLHNQATRLLSDAKKSGYATNVIQEIADEISERQRNVLREVLEIDMGGTQ